MFRGQAPRQARKTNIQPPRPCACGRSDNSCAVGVRNTSWARTEVDVFAVGCMTKGYQLYDHVYVTLFMEGFFVTVCALPP